MYFDLYVELDRVDKHDSRLGYGEFEAILPKLLRWGAEISAEISVTAHSRSHTNYACLTPN